ncbi:unnamed protein product [Symbiodinium natans]|uniref:Uncharacterized protein n=1 Tax=Symbiodinium natans TaxID=878477 RepID=A0A812GK04_9DINO|nr:unnamed protein product [Symbiodinium natans]
MQVQSVQYEQPVAGLAASINPTNSAEPAEWQQIEQAVVSNCLKTEEATAVAVVTPEPAASPSAPCGWVGDQVEPFVAHPAPSAWVTDDNNEDLDIDTPRLSRFEPCAFRRRPSARSESSVAVSEDLLDFVPDRSAWLLHGEKDRPPSAARAPLAPAAYPSAASRWSHRSRTSEKQALQAMLAEFTPRMSEFIPSSKELPSTQQELLHLRPDERLTSSHVDVSLDEVADPDLNAFVPVRHDQGMAGTSAMHLGPPRELRWEVPGLDEGATPRLTQFMPCYPGVRA